MASDRNDNKVIVTDVTLREYGQNIPLAFLRFFEPAVRVRIASGLMGAGCKNIEVLSCVHPTIAPAMDLRALKDVVKGLGKVEGVNLITLVPNEAGYRTFLSLGLGPDGYNHTLSIFFSVIEAHNVANLGRSIADTVKEYQHVVRDATARRIRVVAYLSAVFGFCPQGMNHVLPADLDGVVYYLDMLFDLGVETVTLTDLQGLAQEDETRRIIEGILERRKGAEIEALGYHPHHAVSQKALANSMAAYELGIRRFDSSLGGTGGCVTGAPGNQPTEELVALFGELGVETGINQGEVRSLAEEMNRSVYQKIPLKPRECPLR
jgi:hydroxymethylglutaryl-CoA lyase